jgi:Mce-associated membrane protein
MSPRHRVDTEQTAFFGFEPEPPRRWRLPVLAAVAAVLMAAAITVGTLIAVSHNDYRERIARDVEVVEYVRAFMTTYTTLDPFNANAYADRILAEATGDFARMFAERQTEILIQVARAEPTTGTVLDAGVQRWNENGSADVLVATKISQKAPDGESTIESGSRWIATATKEGDQWKISQLIQVI